MTKNSNFSITVGAALLESASFEKKVANWYAALSIGFSHYPPAAEFWDGMFQDELTHEWTLQRIYEMLPADILAQPISSDIADAIVHTRELLKEKLLVSIKNLNDAYELSRQLESSEINVVFRMLIEQIVPEAVQGDFAQVQVDEHQYKVFDFQIKFGDQAAREKIVFSQ
jgi:hypothetical protein